MGQMSQTAASAKKIILVLNKIDLVPAEVVTEWLKVLRREFPTIAFKASTQEQKSNHAASTGAAMAAPTVTAPTSVSALTSNKCVGGEALLQLLKNYARSLDVKTSITVGIVGYPNVGKSSRPFFVMSFCSGLKLSPPIASGTVCSSSCLPLSPHKQTHTDTYRHINNLSLIHSLFLECLCMQNPLRLLSLHLPHVPPSTRFID
jgi:hypothetical protein